MTAIENKSMITNLQLIYCLRIDNRISEERKLYSYTKLIKSLHVGICGIQVGLGLK